jgi:osmoprotectant transport system ATP-binding protein
VFVTHDIDEAIKMGDRIAIMQRGGKLAQYAPPAELLMHPANPFVEDFVGADRALKRLSLQRVRDVDLWTEDDIPYKLDVDADGKPLAWLSPDGRRSPATPVLELDDVLRDALSDLLAEESQYGPVVNERGQVVGVLSIEILAHALQEQVAA